MTSTRSAVRTLALSALLAAACGGNSTDQKTPYDPYSGTPPLGTAIQQSDGTDIGTTGWKWVAFPDSTCTNADQTTSETGLAISWGTSSDVVIFLAGGGACWDYATCYAGSATTGPFGASQFETDIYTKYPNSWVHRDKLPAALANATVVYVPYCTGDVHSGNAVTTYQPPVSGLGLQPITWHHVGHTNLMVFLKRLGATFTNPGKLVVAGSSAGGFGALANYPAFKWYWKDAKSYLIDDSGPPLIGNAIPATSRDAWYSSWNMGVSLDAFCTGCRSDMSQGLKELEKRYPNDRTALLSHLQDETIRDFFGTFTVTSTFPYVTLTPMDATAFETALKALGTTVMDPATSNQKYFFTSGTAHPMLIPDPAAITTPSPGLSTWIEYMLSDSTSWTSATQ